MKKRLILAIAVILVVSLSVVTGFVASADNETILEDKNPNLTYLQVKGEYESWDTTKTSFYTHENGSSKYGFQTNAYNVWWTTDDFDFAYKKYNFNFGSKAEMTIETTITELGPQLFANAACGIMVRSGLSNNASHVNLQIRPSQVLVAYRVSEGAGSSQGPTINNITPTFPIKLKMVVKNGKVTCYYAMNGGAYVKLSPSIPFVYGESLYVGLEAYSGVQEYIDKVEFDGLSVKIDAPEGTKYDEPSGDISSGEAEEEREVLTDDNIYPEDTLLAETFSDGEVEGDDKTVYNATWKNNCLDTRESILMNEDKTNYYLKKDYDSTYFVADSVNKTNPRYWADYSFESDVYIYKDVLEDEAKNLTFMMRFNDISQYGYYYYAVQLHDGNKISIGAVLGRGSIGFSPTILETKDFEYLSSDIAEKWARVKIVCFDNTITVYWNGQEIISYTDNTNNVMGTGSVGIWSSGLGVELDNILVRNIEDYYGDTFDNTICANWDEERPSIVDKYVENGWLNYEKGGSEK